MVYPRPLLIQNLTTGRFPVLELVKPPFILYKCYPEELRTGLDQWYYTAKLGTSCIYPDKWVVASCVKKTNICLIGLLCQEPKMPLTYRILCAGGSKALVVIRFVKL